MSRDPHGDFWRGLRNGLAVSLPAWTMLAMLVLFTTCPG